MQEIIFALKDVYFSYLGRFPALCGIDMDIAKGEKLAVIGANGCGKSTLLHLLDGLFFPDKGSIKAFGRQLDELAFSDESFAKSFRKKVGLVFQNSDVQLFCPTVEEDIVFGPLQMEVPRDEIEKRLQELSGLLGIKGFLDRAPHQLSVGEKKKVAIAATLAIEPDVIILDEPTAGLDPRTTRQIIDIVLEANDAGKTIITATHDLHIVEEISDKVYVFGHDKKIVRQGEPSAILRDTEFLQQNNLIHIHSHRHLGKVHMHPHQHIDDHHHEA